jgi:hypothetical protein
MIKIYYFFFLIGDDGHRSHYLSRAKRALYHLSYIPDSFIAFIFIIYLIYAHHEFIIIVLSKLN